MPISLTELKKRNPKTKLFKKAKKQFGTTPDYREAGYILPDGKLLDLSGKNIGGTPFTRSLDHREISRALNTGGKGISGDKSMDFFERQGALRFSFIPARPSLKESSSMNISLNTFQKPNEKQIQILRRGVAVCRRVSGTCDIAFDVFFNNGDRCISQDEGFIDNASQRDINEIISKLSTCKRKDKK